MPSINLQFKRVSSRIGKAARSVTPETFEDWGAGYAQNLTAGLGPGEDRELPNNEHTKGLDWDGSRGLKGAARGVEAEARGNRGGDPREKFAPSYAEVEAALGADAKAREEEERSLRARQLVAEYLKRPLEPTPPRRPLRAEFPVHRIDSVETPAPFDTFRVGPVPVVVPPVDVDQVLSAGTGEGTPFGGRSGKRVFSRDEQGRLVDITSKDEVGSLGEYPGPYKFNEWNRYLDTMFGADFAAELTQGGAVGLGELAGEGILKSIATSYKDRVVDPGVRRLREGPTPPSSRRSPWERPDAEAASMGSDPTPRLKREKTPSRGGPEGDTSEGSDPPYLERLLEPVKWVRGAFEPDSAERALEEFEKQQRAAKNRKAHSTS